MDAASFWWGLAMGLILGAILMMALVEHIF